MDLGDIGLGIGAGLGLGLGGGSGSGFMSGQVREKGPRLVHMSGPMQDLGPAQDREVEVEVRDLGRGGVLGSGGDYGECRGYGEGYGRGDGK
ncbi:hypothetical protein CDL15_Pgr015291 [Punica granatum]|uniref:Uncharacterized protein n=1 Tax=Punica granatum TaxID=22663 RepID=A0A218VZM9_PUNGR|nr:hypothetical protein CDL15_Pgr015291 [Punica granatum]